MTHERWRGPTSEAEIAHLEEVLGVTLPAEYRAFLADHGSGFTGSTEVYGVANQPTGVPSLEWVVLRLAQRGFIRPCGVIPISDLGNGDYVSVLAEETRGFVAGTVVFWSPGRSDEVKLERVAPGFAEWLAQVAGGSR